MSPIKVFFFVFCLTFGGAVVGMTIRPRLRDYHLSEESKAVLKAARSVIIGLAALTLGMLISSAKNSFEKKNEEIKMQAAKVITLGRVLNDYGPQADKARATLREVIGLEVERIDFVAQHDVDPEKEMSKHTMGALRREIMQLKPENENQTWMKSTALALGQQVLESRWRVYLELSSSFQRPLGGLLVLWLVSIFFSFGLVAPRNAVVVGGLGMAALSMAGAIYFVLELDMPYQGLITISTRPLKLAIEQLGAV